MIINIDESAGFCWGVVRTIENVEDVLKKFPKEKVYVLGQIIHNPREIERLEDEGLNTIMHEKLSDLPKKSKVIIRAHGEPPATYIKANELAINLIDATCPLVKALQKRVRKYYLDGWQILIFGKKDHAEVIGLRGVCNDECIVIRSVDEALDNIDLSKKTVLFSQTTMDRKTFNEIKTAIENKIKFIQSGISNELTFIAKDTICKYVAERDLILQKFASENDIIIFVAGRNSSNGKILFNICHNTNSMTYFIEDISEMKVEWFNNVGKVGITGATSTPKWYLNLVKSEIEKNIT
jgi:4-hydroxy-3-methylbut-2-en-1-yl diphosphate reductase